MAQPLIAAPQDFITEKTPDAFHEPQEIRCSFRTEGVEALRYFKSEKNIAQLRSLLVAPDFYLSGGGDLTFKSYSVRDSSCQVLQDWGLDVPKPVIVETVTNKVVTP